MDEIGLLKRLNGSHATVGRGRDYLHRNDMLHWLLERARMRSDRNGGAMCFVLLRWEKLSRRQLIRVSRVLQRRLRATDDAGHWDRGQIAILLPDTPYAGGVVVCDELRQLLTAAGVPPTRCRLYVYSRDQFDHFDDADYPADDDAPPREPLETLLVEPLPGWKRAMDVLVAFSGLVLTSPLLLTAAALIKATSPGPVFFRQHRGGIGGRPFTILKFRTMVADAEQRKPNLLNRNEQDGPAFKISDDPRVTTIGRILRTTSIDELPQLLNVLAGDMTIVGPRPLPCVESEQCAGWQRRRLLVTPGLTCIWQIKGRSRVTFDEWVRMDLQYTMSRTLWHDLKIMLLTIPAVLSRRGAQ